MSERIEESVLELLYEAYFEERDMSTDQIKADFKNLYEAMHGKTMHEIDNVIYPVSALCRDHEMNGFIHGIKVGIQLHKELTTGIPQ